MSTDNEDGVSIPIKCLIEVVDKNTADVKETVNFAIVSRKSLFKDLVKTVLQKLGYSAREMSNATGAVQFKNWKALDLSSLCINPQSTVEDMLSDLAAVATLRIRIISKEFEEDLKNKILLHLLSKSNDILSKSGCPLSKGQVEKVINGENDLSTDISCQFYQWYSRQQDLNSQSPPIKPMMDVAPSVLRVPSRTPRPRISFDQEEVSQLQSWFDINPHPSKAQMAKYMNELNAQPSRQGKGLDLTNIMYWFKNARAAARRNGKPITSDDLSDDDDRQSMKDDTGAPTLPNKNAVYMISNPLLNTNSSPSEDEESEMDEDVSVTDDQDSVRMDGSKQTGDTTSNLNEPNDTNLRPETGDQPPRSQATPGFSSSSSSPQNPLLANGMLSMAQRLNNYNIYGAALPMAQYFMNSPFYKDWNEKIAAHTQAHGAQQNSTPKSEPKMSPNTLHEMKMDRQKRHRAFIDPVSEIPKLEQYFLKDTHPSHYVIDQICDELNRGEFRSRYPKLSAKNIQLWFKNHRAKVKRMRVGGGADLSTTSFHL